MNKNPHPALSRSTGRGRLRICFITGTRAEFGLMRSTLRAIQSHKKLQLQIIATGMHLSRRHGYTLSEIKREFTVNATVPWKGHQAVATGKAVGGIAGALAELQPDIVLVVGDRVEAFAAATAAHLSGIAVAHVHGGDRAMGQVDDSLRHAITKLSHVHFPATESSAQRLCKLGEDDWRIHRVGSPGIDGIVKDAARGKLPEGVRSPFALLVLHPLGSNDAEIANAVLDGVRASRLKQIVGVYPNNDPGSEAIIRCWEKRRGEFSHLLKSAPRQQYLRLLQCAAVLVGNSSSGIIEAASFGTPVIDVGPRQLGREHGENVLHVPADSRAITRAVNGFVGDGWQKRFAAANPYGGGATGRVIAQTLAGLIITPALLRKLIAY